jgi:hypothetical protein
LWNKQTIIRTFVASKYPPRKCINYSKKCNEKKNLFHNVHGFRDTSNFVLFEVRLNTIRRETICLDEKLETNDLQVSLAHVVIRTQLRKHANYYITLYFILFAYTKSLSAIINSNTMFSLL